jgi:hypothetical protein
MGTKIEKLQTQLMRQGLKTDEDFFINYSVRDLVTIDIAVNYQGKKIAFMNKLSASKIQKLVNLGWKPVEIPKQILITDQWLKNFLI